MSARLINSFKLIRGNLPLQGAMAEVAEVAGRHTAFALMRHFGGRRLRIPSQPRTLSKQHPIVRAIGTEAAHQVCRRIFGDVNVPIGPFTDNTLKFYTFAKRRRSGASVSLAADGLRIDQRTSWKWNRIVEDGAISNRDFIAFGKAIGDEW